MRIQVLSDLHADFNREMQAPRLADADAVIVAGDTRHGLGLGLAYLRRSFPEPVPLIVIAGNHEFYGSSLEAEFSAGRQTARTLGISLLEEESVEIGGVRVLGTTLWTDYEFFGPKTRDTALHAARIGLNDHRLIAAAPGSRPAFQPEDARERHLASRRFLETALAAPFNGPTVVVTHHLPHEKSVSRRFGANPLTPAFVSDLSDVIETYQPELWIHGHTHTSFDYRVGKTRIVCNPHGYGGENPAFDPALVVEV